MRTASALPLTVSTTGRLVRCTWLSISFVFRLRSVTERISSEGLRDIDEPPYWASKADTKYSTLFSAQQCTGSRGLSIDYLPNTPARFSFVGPQECRAELAPAIALYPARAILPRGRGF